MKKVIMLVTLTLMVMMGTAQAQTWGSLVKEGNATFVGGFYAAVSYACLKTDYTNDTGYWASGKATIPYEKGCAKAIYDAMFGEVTTPVEEPVAVTIPISEGSEGYKYLYAHTFPNYHQRH